MATLLTLVILAHAQPAFEVETLGGKVIAGSLVQLSDERITVQTADGPVRVAVDQLTGLGPAHAPPESREQPGVWVDLADGSAVVGSDYTARDDHAQLTLLNGEVVELPTDDVAAVRFQPPAGQIAAEWQQLVKTGADRDLLVVRNGETIDYHGGALGDVTDTVVHFELDGDVLPVKRAKLYGLIYYRAAGRVFDDVVCRVVDADGSRWAVRSLALEGGNLCCTTAGGLEVTRPLAAVVRVDFSQNNVVYLSDLAPDRVDWTPFFGPGAGLDVLARFFGPREDRSLESGPLELEGKPYRKGLALQSRTSVAYRLPGPFRRFEAVVGIDDRVRPRGNARLVIRGDDRVLLETTIAGTDTPRPLDLDLTGVRRLVILVDFGDDLDVADHVDLCDARMVK